MLLKRSVVTTASCVGCDQDQEGVYMRLTGLQDYITCETNTLDHVDTTDFSPSQIGTFDTEKDAKVDGEAAIRVHSRERLTLLL